LRNLNLLSKEYGLLQLSDNNTFIENPEKLIKASIKRAYKRKYADAGISRALYQHNYRTLLKAVEKGMKKDFGKIKLGTPDWEFTQNLKYNIAVFAAFKNHDETMTIASLLTDKTGKIRPWKDFKEEALKVSQKYNVTHLKAEYNRAQSSARAAKDWQRYQNRKSLYPNLRYVATKDERTRDDHMALDGAVYPIDHSFWDTYYPPNDWGCRCRVEPTADDEVSRTEITIKPDFKNNPGKTARIFTPDHKYIRDAKPEFKQRIKEFVERNLRNSKDVLAAHKKYQAYDNNWSRAFFNVDTGGFNVYHKLHAFDKVGGKYEIRGGELLAKQGKQIEFLNESGAIKTADWNFDNKIWEFKAITSNSSSAIKNQINKARKQAERVILYFDKWPGETTIKDGINRFLGQVKAHNYDKYPDVFILSKDGKLVRYLEGRK